MVFEKVNPQDPMGDLLRIFVWPGLKLRTGHGENSAQKFNRYNKPRRIPKHLTRTDVRGGRRTNGWVRPVKRQHHIDVKFVDVAFVPEFMVVESRVVRPVVVKAPLPPRGKTIFEKYLEMRRK